MIKPGNTKKYNILTLGSILFAFTLVAVLSVGFSGWVVNPNANINIDANIADVTEINKCLTFDSSYNPKITNYTINGFFDESTKTTITNGTLTIPFQMNSEDKTLGKLMGSPSIFSVAVTLMSANPSLQLFNKIDISEAKINFSNNLNCYQTGIFSNSVSASNKASTSERVYDASFVFKSFPFFENNIVACSLSYTFSLSKNINFTSDIFNKLGDAEEFNFRVTMGITL